ESTPDGGTVVLSLCGTGSASTFGNHSTSAGHPEPTTTSRLGCFYDPAGNRCLVSNAQSWLGRRDHAFLLLALQTGLRLSEMTALRHEDVWLGTGPHVRCCGKGRKERCTPLAKSTVAVLKAWIREQGREDSKTLFPSIRGGALSPAGVQHMLARHV